MSVDVIKTRGGAAEITWTPRKDDPRGWLARSVESDQLADALTALATEDTGTLGSTEEMRRIARHTQEVIRLLERRTRGIAVELRRTGNSWAEIANALYDDSSRTSSARRVYEAGMRQAGFGGLATSDNTQAGFGGLATSDNTED